MSTKILQFSQYGRDIIATGGINLLDSNTHTYFLVKEEIIHPASLLRLPKRPLLSIRDCTLLIGRTRQAFSSQLISS